MPRSYLNDELIDYFLSSLAYSYLRDFHLSLVYEMLPSISTTLMITSAMTYSVHLSSPKTLTTLQGLIGASYYGLGPGLGTFLGDHIVHWLGSYSLLNNSYCISNTSELGDYISKFKGLFLQPLLTIYSNLNVIFLFN